ISSILLLFSLALPPAGPVWAQGKALPADLAFVSPDAAGFVHIRLADVWKSDFLKMWRDSVLAAGEKALAAFDERFFPRPSSLERVTAFAMMPKGEKAGPDEPVVVLRTSKPIDKATFQKRTLPGAELQKTNDGIFLVDAKRRIEVYFVDDQTLAVSAPGRI